jgi:Cu-processing system permease protein
VHEEAGLLALEVLGQLPVAGGPPGLGADRAQLLGHLAGHVLEYADIRGAALARGLELLEEAGLSALAETKVGELSGGMRQRLGFTLALLTDPQILVLDEPSASLDAASRAWLARRLREVAAQGCTVLVSTHAGQELLDAGDLTVTLDDGRVAATTRRVADSDDACVPVRFGTPDVGAKLGRVRPIVMKELRDAVTNRWLIAYTVLLAALGLAATVSGLDSASGLAVQAFGRTTATLMNLCLLLSPLVAVLMGAASIAGEHERGTLEHLLAQPLTRSQLLLGKHAGLLAALTGATVIGFLPAGVMVAAAAGPELFGRYLLFPAIAALVGAAMVGIGVLISVSSRSAVQAQGTAVFAWFAFVLLYDLLLMGVLATSGIPPEWLAALLVVNPVDSARVLGVLTLEPELYLLGPSGAYLTARLSPVGASALLLGALGLWTALPVAAAAVWFSLPVRRSRRDEARKRICPAGDNDGARGRDRVCVREGVA